MEPVTEQEEVLANIRAPFVIHASGHEGPLELILELIEKRKLHVNELSIS
jgi:chromatin segregation and condensation protein Rec8/ScpA/Scc1 (kleisin family)